MFLDRIVLITRSSLNCVRNFSPKARNSRKTVVKTERSFLPKESVNETYTGNNSLYGPVICSLATAGGIFCVGAIYQYENFRRRRQKQSLLFAKSGSFRREINRKWQSFSLPQKLATGIIALNTCVFLSWRLSNYVPRLQVFMCRNFLSTPTNKGAVCRSAFLSSWSHYAPFHLFCNMYVLWSFTPILYSLMGKEQFLSFYMAAGSISGIISVLHKAVFRIAAPSLGASGAVIACLGLVCTASPDSRLSIAFVDMLLPHSFSARTGMYCLIAFDVAGLLLRWRLLDHAAHLGGMLFGIFYATYGHKFIWGNRTVITNRWAKIREKLFPER